MKNLLIVFAVCVLASGVFAQGMEQELANLKKHLELPETYIVETGSLSLPSGDTTKVYIATGLDLGAKNNFERWFIDWNRKNASKYGSIKVVDNWLEADLIVARYRVLENVQNVTETRSIVLPGTVWDPASNSTVTRPVSTTRSRTSATVPVYAYILQNDRQKLVILKRYVDTASLTETRSSGESLRDDLYAVLKARAKRK